MTLWLRVEASAATGFGHLMRCVAAAEAAQDEGVSTCFVGDYDAFVEGMLDQRGFRRAPSDTWPDQVEAGDTVLFDGYGFTTGDHRALPAGVVRGAVDDYGHGQFEVEVLVNPNLPARTDYKLPAAAKLLIGPRYALIREEFVGRRRRRLGRHLLVTFGGSDVGGLGPDVAAWAIEHGHFEVTLLLGPAAPERTTHPHAQIVRAPADVGTAFDRADVAIAAAGATTWELLAMGIPPALVEVTDNQGTVASPLADRGLAVFLGQPPLTRSAVWAALDTLADLGIRGLLAARAREVVDGVGARRVVRTLLSHS